MFHLDTNIVIAFVNGNERVGERFDKALPDVAISTVVLGEMHYGVLNSKYVRENLRRNEDFLELVRLVSYNERCAEAYAHVRMELKRKGRTGGDADAMIAATALVHNATLVTHNTKHFEAIADLKLEDWLTD